MSVEREYTEVLAEPESRQGIHQNSKTYKSSVLILSKDLYGNVGGGQTAYQAIIAARPDTRFFYFLENEPSKTNRPTNCVGIPFSLYYRENVGDLPASLEYFYSDYILAWQYARSFVEAFPNEDLDVVDTPDYATSGLFIADALKQHGVKVGSVSLALHGTISSAFEDEWGPCADPRLMAQLRTKERLQYRALDSRYALSEAYADELTAKSGGHKANLIDPLLIVGPVSPVTTHGGGVPDLAFIGRRERRKGPDIFIDALWSQDRATYGSAKLIGGASEGISGVSGDPILAAMAKMRGLDIEFVKNMSRTAINELFLARTVVVLPSRYDQFNLVALEALRLGTPVLISDGAGAARWIKSNLPELSDLVFDLSGARAIDQAIKHILDDYDGTRARVCEALLKRNLNPQIETLQTMYECAQVTCSSAREHLQTLQARLNAFNRPRDIESDPVGLFATNITSTNRGYSQSLPAWKRAILESPLKSIAYAYHDLKTSTGKPVEVPSRGSNKSETKPVFTRQMLEAETKKLQASLADRSPRALDMLQGAQDLEGTRSRILRMPEQTQDDIKIKLKTLADEIPGRLVGRQLLFRELMRLERKRTDGDLVAATYGLRLMRWQGEDTFGDLGFVMRALKTGGFDKEATVADAMFGNSQTVNAQLKVILRNQFEGQKTKKAGGFEITDDRRRKKTVKVSIIVSLYNAASKLPDFMRQVSGQSLFAKDEIEVILVDSGSPTNEYAVFKSLMETLPLPTLFVRTKARETIQSAWNRGIALARGEYLSFLGVDEGVHPKAFEVLAQALDDDKDTHWVMADSVVTEVNRHGAFKSDVMVYDRNGYSQGLVYLETCYLSWVGGLYRKSIHEQFGMYDETFRGAGDTEFKSRMLPHLNSKHIPQKLGLFLNYPEERTTQHPRAEIEDLRAWYIYRSKPGVAYVWDNKSIADVETFFKTCLSYRKSYCGHLSTDFEMAEAVSHYMVERGENPDFANRALESCIKMNKIIRSIETIDMLLSPDDRKLEVLRALEAAKVQELEAQSHFSLTQRPRFEIVNDNRFEQHWYSWSS
jgi:glycosyltransferase involved in cell wall biosynthesis